MKVLDAVLEQCCKGFSGGIKPWKTARDNGDPEIYSLAQHHSVPTRLLDWTAHPWFAAFFAARDAAGKKQPSHIAVWALDVSACRADSQCLIRFQWCGRRFDVEYLHSQHGLFIHRTDADQWFFANGEWPQILDAIPKVAVRLVTLPIEQVESLLELLKAEFISEVHLMPTFDHVIRSL